MKALHQTENPAYRTPFGAAQLNCAVTLTLDTWEGMARSCQLRLWQEGHGESFVPMEAREVSAPDGSGAPCRRFSATISPEHLGVLWYSFQLEAADGSTQWYGAEEGWVTGTGSLYGWTPPSFQMTVYQPRAIQPDWYREGVVYQIFPDRFSRGEDWPQRAQDALSTPRKGPRRALVEDWNQAPTYQREDNGDIAQWDFYGGSLQGIRQRLDYLQDLGVTVLYLNPIFEAASNHRYDTADYLQIDPMLGTQEDFEALCQDAATRGMSVILDGVFNHSGQDSRYFNAYGNYADTGAIQDPASPYRDWFHINDDGTYGSWWGIKDLPEYNEDSPSLRQYVCGEDGVVRHWLRAGARGWRLDVADELPDSFIEDIKAAAVAEQGDALVIGEVWEDASNKYAYSQLRHYFQGTELDGVMNYPFRTTVIEYLTGAISAPVAARRMQQLAENYPADNFACNLNLLGSHDRERIMTMLGGAPAAGSLTDEQRAAFRLDPQQRQLAKNRLNLAVLLQMTMPGVPSIYYGDEAGLEGFSDPYNRATMPWDGADADCLAMHRSAIALRRSLPLFTQGSFQPVSFGNEVLGWWRRDIARSGQHAATESVCVLVNRSPWDHVTVTVKAEGEVVSELGRAQAAAIADGFVTVTLAPFESSVLYFHPAQRLQEPLAPGKGVIAHITSLPNPAAGTTGCTMANAAAGTAAGTATGTAANTAADTTAGVPSAVPQAPGTLGAPALAFVDWLADRGYTYWQMLPVNPTDEYGSPYAGLSAFAGNPNLICWPRPEEGSLLTDVQVREAYLESLAQHPDYAAFCEDNRHWLDAYACFCAFKVSVGEKPWQEWPSLYRNWNPDMVTWPEQEARLERVRRTQFAFHLQWTQLRTYANSKGIRIIGDLPMYVSADSSDVWSNTSQFALNQQGYPASLAGCPPDDFAADGQIWGNPTFNWDAMRQDGYQWWTRRLARMFALYDFVRLDHFLGFSSYYSIQEGQTALEGCWKYGPSKDLFAHARHAFGHVLPLVGENLGTITPAVRSLVANTGFPGMDVLQFSDTDPRYDYRPAPRSLVYLSTHDTSTLIGWCQQHYGLSREDAAAQAARLMEDALKLVEAEGRVVMMQLQDVLGLGDEARMNVPGVAEGNWSWQAASL